MSAIVKILITIIMIAAVLGSGCIQPAAVPQTATMAPVLNMTVPFGPVPVPSQNGINLAYELELQPADNQVPVVEKVEILDTASGKILYTADSEMLSVLYHPASVPPPTAAELRNGTGKIPRPRVSLWFVVSPDAVPDRLVHRVLLNRTAAGLPPVTVTGAEVAVKKDFAPVIIGSPMQGPGWLAMETTSPFTHHFSAQITLNGTTRVPQRYAQDWILLDPVSGQAAAGNASLARNYFGFGKEIRSVSDGIVVEAGDGLADIETIYSAPAPTIETIAGNYAIVDIGNTKYACYAHMINGSVRVKAGDYVREGQVLGLMGNSGNSDLPHLHFQIVTDTPSLLGAEGYPHVYRSFNMTGKVNVTRAEERFALDSKERVWSEFGNFIEFFPPVPQDNRLVENNVIVRFP
ncbi:MAG: M23 family metallopeptidase [Methanoregula sp.]|nr:M23 family metallopeptidase [Methanoregula sp.]